jgi:glyoxylase-like metal-dependent hydrolase (beta-lactamase superfamily II)/8-oxo-dGTP pyrophosphatase MutT (NUDIX family)
MSDPKKAAAAIVLRGDDEFEVLLAKRSRDLRFMGGHFVFPGGRIDVDEGNAFVVGDADESVRTAVHAAAREAFEEAGLLCADDGAINEAALADARRSMLAGSCTFDEVLARFGVTLPLDEFTRAGNWVTPAFSPIRFNTSYFVYRYGGACTPSVTGDEMTAVDWYRPWDALRIWRAGDIRLSTPVAYTLHYLARFGYPDALPYLQRELGHVDGRMEKVELRCGIYIMPLPTTPLPPATHTNCMIVGEEEVVVIDPGPTGAEEQAWLALQLDRLLEFGGRIVGVLLTHAHGDHAGAAAFLRERYGAPVWAHAITNRELALSVDRELEDGDEIVLRGYPDWRLRCLHTPGHDPGHVCVLEEESGTLIAGDMIANPGTVVISERIGGDMTAYLESLERLKGLGAKMLVPAHGMPVGKVAEKLQETIDHRLAREAKVRAALDRGLRRMGELVPTVYDDVAQDLWPLARETLQAHLRRLGVEVEE